ncbi:peptidase inhibitor family I36 protein [Micromonospora radicis]|uniref:peptidase inhibitor family I36 protein n=1 Tax=Micromonospora radicis TaxID=1894971 RepID=UPI0011C3E94D|nr:peptidase inhibitor family I36 protein [Micromonospora radicis]
MTPASGIAAPASSDSYDWESATVAPTERQLAAGIADVLKRTPGSRQIGPAEIELAPGLIMQLPPANGGARGAEADPPCPSLYMCAYAHRQYTNPSLNFTVCGREWNLGNYAYPGGGVWNDKISSINNNQSSGTWSYFYDHVGNNNWDRILSVAAGTRRANLALDAAESGGGNANDRIDGVHVCGPVPSPWKPNWP